MSPRDIAVGKTHLSSETIKLGCKQDLNEVVGMITHKTNKKQKAIHCDTKNQELLCKGVDCILKCIINIYKTSIDIYNSAYLINRF